MLQGLTAHYLSHSAFALGPGHSCLVHAAAGGVGQLLTQLAKSRGATVIGTVGSAEKAQIARRRGCDHVILYREADFRDEVMRITGGRGVEVVYDSVGRDTIGRSIRCLKRRGLCVMYGASSGQVAGIAPLDLAEAGSVFFTRPHLADYTADAAEIAARAQALFEAYAAGRLQVAVHDVLELADAAEAHRILESRGTRGKLLLRTA
jgi:NADPH2:quinone reductase